MKFAFICALFLLTIQQQSTNARQQASGSNKLLRHSRNPQHSIANYFSGPYTLNPKHHTQNQNS